MLQAHGIAVQRGERQILSDIDLALPAGQVIGVLGANGAGKSTLLAALAGELSPSTGRITLNGRPLSAWSAAELARCRAVLPQSPSLQFDLPVATVIGMGTSFGVIAAQGEGVGVAHAGVGDAQQHFARAGRGHVDFDNLQGFAGFKGNGGA